MRRTFIWEQCVGFFLLKTFVGRTSPHLKSTAGAFRCEKSELGYQWKRKSIIFFLSKTNMTDQSAGAAVTEYDVNSCTLCTPRTAAVWGTVVTTVSACLKATSRDWCVALNLIVTSEKSRIIKCKKNDTLTHTLLWLMRLLNLSQTAGKPVLANSCQTSGSCQVIQMADTDELMCQSFLFYL